MEEIKINEIIKDSNDYHGIGIKSDKFVIHFFCDKYDDLEKPRKYLHEEVTFADEVRDKDLTIYNIVCEKLYCKCKALFEEMKIDNHFQLDNENVVIHCL